MWHESAWAVDPETGMMRGVIQGVSKTAILTLRARADEHTREDGYFSDPWAVDWLAQLGWPAELDGWYSAKSQHSLAARADEFDWICRSHLEEFPGAAVVELGAGFSSRCLRLSELQPTTWIDLDLPEVIEARARLASFPAFHRHVAGSVVDLGLIRKLQVPVDVPPLFLLEGLVYYLPKDLARDLVRTIGAHFPGAIVAFDIMGQTDEADVSTRARRAGIEFTWFQEPPFERAWADFGLHALEGREPDVLLESAIERYCARLGPASQAWVTAMATLPSVRATRSGTIWGSTR